ncbi:hypothetical protein BD779DRAFT_1472809 [Infundibulicybe gibba]|nr:hypothetical protein BD779DRAFT_1472809 [Infundibulicybe gibba]
MSSRCITNPELFSGLTEVDVNFEKFFLIGRPKKISADFTIRLTEYTYLPKIAEPRRDWVASVAVPAFIAHGSRNTVHKFATIGTGGGLDAVAALEIFDLEKLAITDLHPTVVAAAAHNIRAAAGSNAALFNTVQNLIAIPGDICTPLAGEVGQFDLIYENLPNIPIDAGHILDSGQTSSTYVPTRTEAIPSVATNNLLALHWLALEQAKHILSPTGAIISSMGARVPISSLVSMARSAGFNAHVLIYTWKIQSEPEEVIGGYKRSQEAGLGPFYFYPASVLESTFESLSPMAAGLNAVDIEHQISPHRLNAIEAYNAYKAGTIVAHTVAVIRSTPVTDILREA